nr:MAG TPA: Sarcosine oxidase, delta subunit family [Caudoviricetes sp.]
MSFKLQSFSLRLPALAVSDFKIICPLCGVLRPSEGF